MFIVRGKNKMGYWESIVLDEKAIPEALHNSKKYFLEISSIEQFSPPDESKENEQK